jgi:predicted DNA-binding transcriptional regulator AlpA
MNLLLELEAANRLRLARTTMAGMRSRGTGPEWIKLGGKVFYRPEALDAWVESCTHTPSPVAAHGDEGGDD